MNDFEDDERLLRQALRREPAPPDFAARLMARLPERPARPVVIPFWRRPVTLALAAGLCIAALVPPVAFDYRRRQQERGLEARRQLLLALRITGNTLQETKHRVQRATNRAL